MMNLWKRNAVVAAIVLFVCVAVYLNWSYDQSDTALGDSSVSAGKTLGEAELVNSDSQILLSDSSADGSAAAESSAESALAAEDGEWAEDALGEEELAADTGSYFDTARLNREEARDSALSILQETVDDPEADEAAVSAAAESITAMASATLQESEIESLVLAKGYTDCVAFIGDNSVSVVVSAGGVDLEAEDVAVITDIVCGETDFSASSVKVVQAEE
ncbi:MAG: SpoIIIAH-like family protein [Clostridiales bacterium]|nr:SpoIIIAH-like family protein [Clostridiales bacterium]